MNFKGWLRTFYGVTENCWRCKFNKCIADMTVASSRSLYRWRRGRRLKGIGYRTSLDLKVTRQQQTMTTTDERLTTFLRDLTGALERGELCPRQLQSVGEFFMSYQFQERAAQDSDESAPPPPRFSQEELIKFLSLGWYVYQVLLNQETLPGCYDDVD